MPSKAGLSRKRKVVTVEKSDQIEEAEEAEEAEDEVVEVTDTPEKPWKKPKRRGGQKKVQVDPPDNMMKISKSDLGMDGFLKVYFYRLHTTPPVQYFLF